MARLQPERRDQQKPIARILQVLSRLYPTAKTELRHDNPLELLVATILSAQCTDKRVNEVTPKLFQKYRSAKDFSQAKRSELETLIRSTGFFRNKAKSIQEACQKIVEKHEGQVPATMEELRSLSGVGRKTANVILGSAFGKAEGIVVDTHVTRLSQRLGLTVQKDPEKIEKDLIKDVPRQKWIAFSHQLVWHGRRVCKAIRPRCQECELLSLCPSARSYIEIS